MLDWSNHITMRGMNPLQKLLDFLDRLDATKIAFKLDHHRSEAVMVCIDVPGERWEVEFFASGEVEIEVFRSDGSIKCEKEIDRLFRCFSV